MDLRTWTPLIDLEREMRSALDRYWPADVKERPSFRVPADMRREDDDLVISLELPGIDPSEDVEVSIENDTLHVSGEKTEEKETKDGDRLMWERRFGRFERRVALPDGVDADAVEATYDKGVLTVRVPWPTEAKVEPHKIEVSAKS